MNNLKSGDLIFKDSDQIGAKIVKYFMRSPNLLTDIYRMITGKLEKVEYFHPAMIISDTQMIEQQKKVQITDIKLGDKYIVFRPKLQFGVPISNPTESNLVWYAKREIGMPWGVLHTFGRLLTWLTGIPYFARYLKREDEEVSAGRVARWLYNAYNETFGKQTYQEATTHDMVKWMKNRPDLYEEIEAKGKNFFRFQFKD